MSTEEKITFNVVGPIQQGVLTEEQAEELRQMVANQPCDVYWGSHGCSLKRGHEGNHRCLSEDGAEITGTDVCSEVDRNGWSMDGSFQWALYGDDAP